MLKLKRVLGVLILISVIALGVVVWRFMDQPSPEELVEMLPEDVDLALQNLHYTQNEDGRRRWTLDADKAEYLKDGNKATLETVKLLYYKARSFGDVQLEAERGELDQNSRELDVWGNVVLTTERQEQFFTEHLHYNDQQRRLSTEKPVRIVTPRLTLTGTGMDIEIERGRMLIKQDVKALLLPGHGEKQRNE